MTVTLSKGKQWANNSHHQCIDDNNAYYDAQVTCKACLKVAKRFADNADTPDAAGRTCAP